MVDNFIEKGTLYGDNKYKFSWICVNVIKMQNYVVHV